MKRTALLAAGVAGFLLSGPALAQTVTRDSVRTLENGETITTNRTRTTTEDGTSLSVTGTTSTGESWERRRTGSFDAETGTRSWTGGGASSTGRSWTGEGSGRCLNGVCTRSRTVTGVDGASRTVTNMRTRIAPGAGSRTVTGPRGTVRRNWRRVK